MPAQQACAGPLSVIYVRLYVCAGIFQMPAQTPTVNNNLNVFTKSEQELKNSHSIADIQ